MVVCRFFQEGSCRFGERCRFEHIYGSKYSYRAPQSVNEIDEVYNSGTRRLNSNDVASSIFRNAAQNVSHYSNNQNSVFQHNTHARSSVFDRLGPSKNLSVGFENNQNHQGSAKSIFSQASQKIFGGSQSGNTYETNNAQNLFARAAQNFYGNSFTQKSPFNTQNTVQNVFHISEQPVSNVFDVNPSIFDQSNIEDDIYRNMEDLDENDLEAFKSSDFQLGSIPELPPPKMLCV